MELDRAIKVLEENGFNDVALQLRNWRKIIDLKEKEKLDELENLLISFKTPPDKRRKIIAMQISDIAKLALSIIKFHYPEIKELLNG